VFDSLQEYEEFLASNEDITHYVVEAAIRESAEE
jgi:hypothetical protein